MSYGGMYGAGLRDDVRVESMHPGWVRTNGVTESLPAFDKVVGPLLRPTTFGWQRHEDPVKVRRFLDQVCAATGTTADW